MLNKNLKKLSLLFSLAFVAILTLAACGSSDQGGANEETGTTPGATTSTQDTLTVAVQGNPVRLDPQNSNDSASSLINVQIFETLVRQMEDLTIEPLLAEDWDQVDEYTWEFKIREGVQFHNGDELTVDDVVFSIERGKNSPQTAEILGMIDEVTAVDEHTVRITTAEPFAPLLHHLAHPAGSIVSKADVEAVEADGGNYGVDSDPIGTGPFVFESFTSGDRTVFTANDNYWGTRPAYDHLIVRVIADGNTRAMALETGEVDISLDTIPTEVERMAGNDDINLLRIPNLSTNYMGMNMNNEYLANPLVRQAIAHAVDIDGIMAGVMLNIGQRAVGPIGPNVFGFNPNLEATPFDLDTARELLAEAGYTGTADNPAFTLQLFVNSETQARIDMAVIVRNALEQIGIDVNINQVEWSSFLDATANGESDLFFLGWGTITGDADYGLYSLFHSSSPASAGNRSFYNNPRVDELLEAGRAATDEAEREAIYQEVQEIIVEDQPWVFINHGEVTAGTQLNVRGFNLNPTNAHRFASVYFE